MDRIKLTATRKQFVSGGFYNPNAPSAKPLVVPPLVGPPSALTLASQQQEDQVKVMHIPILIKEEEMVEAEAIEQATGTDANTENVSWCSMMEADNGGKIPFKKIFQKRKKSSERTRGKKLRQNRQLRKSMLPKNALMALNEVKGVTISDFTINSNPDGGFTAIVNVNSVPYDGEGQSKMAAKNQACEKALRDYILVKMTDGAANTDTQLEDDVPMMSLASFAIYKLFAEWEREGYLVPEMHPSVANASAQPVDPNLPYVAAPLIPKEPKKPPVRTELPPNWETMHPATLLCVMRPGLTYIDGGTVGDKPKIMQRLGIIADDQQFVATGRSKKIARRNVAVDVCNTLFNTNFTYYE